MKTLKNDFLEIEYDEVYEETANVISNVIEKKPNMYKSLLNDRKIVLCKETENDENDVVIDYPLSNDEDTYGVGLILLNKILRNGRPFNFLMLLEEIKIEDIYNLIYEFFYAPVKNYEFHVADLITYYCMIIDDYSLLKDYLYNGKEFDFENEADLAKINVFLDTIIENKQGELIDYAMKKLIIDFENTEEKDKKYIIKNLDKLSNIFDEYGSLIKRIPKNDLVGESIDISHDEYLDLLIDCFILISGDRSLCDEYFNDYYKENKIDFYTADSKENCFCDYYGTIRLSPKGKLEDVLVTVHEFAHAHYESINVDKSLEAHNMFKEYYAIYYEALAAGALTNAGYTDDEVFQASKFRYENDQEIMKFLPTTIDLMKKYQNGDSLSKEEVSLLGDNKFLNKLIKNLCANSVKKDFIYLFGSSMVYYASEKPKSEILKIMDEIPFSDNADEIIEKIVPSTTYNNNNSKK